MAGHTLNTDSAPGDPAGPAKPAALRTAIPWVFAIGAFFLVGVFDHGLLKYDETRVAEISREVGMFESPAVPTLGGEPFLEKPPLYFWCSWLSMRLGTESAGFARLPSAIFAIIAGLAMFALARRLSERTPAPLDASGRAAADRSARLEGGVAFVLTVYSAQWWKMGHYAISDTGLAGACAVSFWALHLLLHPRTRGDERLGTLLFPLSVVFAFWFKGVLGIAFPSLAFAGAVCLERRWRELFRPRTIIGFIVVLAFAALWVFALRVARPDGTLAREFLLQNTLYRFLPVSETYQGGHQHSSIFYYFESLPIALLPGSLFGAHAIAQAFRSRRSIASVSIPLAALLLGFACLSLAGTKRSLYLLPLIAPSAVLLAPYWARVLEGSERRWYAREFMLVGLIAVIFTIGFGPIARMILEERIVLAPSLWGILGISISAALVREFFRVRMPTPRIVGLAVVSVYFVFSSSWVSFAEARIGAEAFGRAVGRMVPTSGEVVFYHPTEALRSVVHFSTNRFPPSLGDYSELDRFMAAQGEQWVIFCRRGEFEPRVEIGYQGDVVDVLGGLPGIPVEMGLESVQQRSVQRRSVQRRLEVVANHRVGRSWFFLLAREVESNPTGEQPASSR